MVCKPIRARRGQRSLTPMTRSPSWSAKSLKSFKFRVASGRLRTKQHAVIQVSFTGATLVSRKTKLTPGRADQPSSRIRQLGAAAVGFLALRRPATRIASSRLRPGPVIGFAGGPHPPPAQLGLASRCRPPLPPGTAAERPSGLLALPDRTTVCDDSLISGPSFRAAVRKLRTEGVQHDGEGGAWSGLGDGRRPG